MTDPIDASTEITVAIAALLVVAFVFCLWEATRK